MRLYCFYVAVLCCLMFVVTHVNAQTLVDLGASQTQFDSNPLANFTDVSGQSFKPTQSNVIGGRIGGIERAFGSPPGMVGTFSLELRSSITGSAILDSAGVDAVGTTNQIESSGYFEVEFANRVDVTAGDTYYWVFSESNSQGGTNQGFYRGTDTNTYANGNAYTAVNTSSPNSFDGSNQFNQDFDFQFQTLYDSSVVAVPEPSSFFLIAASATAIGLRRRRR